jgi:hypothetical protein
MTINKLTSGEEIELVDKPNFIYNKEEYKARVILTNEPYNVIASEHIFEPTVDGSMLSIFTFTVVEYE